MVVMWNNTSNLGGKMQFLYSMTENLHSFPMKINVYIGLADLRQMWELIWFNN